MRPGNPPDRGHLIPRHGFPSRISNVTVLPSRSAAEATSARSAAAVRPCLPMTLPRSSGATYSSTSVVPLCSLSTTRTSSGRSVSARARTSTTALHAGVAGPRAHFTAGCRFGSRLRIEVPGDQRADRVRRLRALLQPVVDALPVDVDEGRLGARIVVTEDLDEAAVARGARIGDDDAEERTLLRTCAT